MYSNLCEWAIEVSQMENVLLHFTSIDLFSLFLVFWIDEETKLLNTHWISQPVYPFSLSLSPSNSSFPTKRKQINKTKKIYEPLFLCACDFFSFSQNTNNAFKTNYLHGITKFANKILICLLRCITSHDTATRTILSVFLNKFFASAQITNISMETLIFNGIPWENWQPNNTVNGTRMFKNGKNKQMHENCQ